MRAKGYTAGCDLLEKSYLCGINNNELGNSNRLSML